MKKPVCPVVSCQFYPAQRKTRAPHKKGSISTVVNTITAKRSEMPRHSNGPNLLLCGGACDNILTWFSYTLNVCTTHAARHTNTRLFLREGGSGFADSELDGVEAQRKTQARVRALQSGWSRREWFVAMDARASWRRSHSGRFVGCNISLTMAAKGAGRATSPRRTTLTLRLGLGFSSSPVRSITGWPDELWVTRPIAACP